MEWVEERTGDMEVETKSMYITSLRRFLGQEAEKCKQGKIKIKEALLFRWETLQYAYLFLIKI
jgi:hypothetical protein